MSGDKTSKLVKDKYSLVTQIFLTVFWVSAVYNFPMQEIFGDKLTVLSSIFSLFVDGTLLILCLWVIRSKIDWTILLAFLALSAYSTIFANHESFLNFFNGIRLYFGYILVVPIYRYLISYEGRNHKFIEKFDKTLYIFLWVQVPCMVYQCIKYGAFDQVGGSLGWMQSGVVSIMIYLISFYLMQKRWDDNLTYLENLKKNWILVFLLFPTFLNETKVSFVFILLYFVFLVPFDRKFILRLLYLSPVFIVAVVAGGYIYVSFFSGNDNMISNADDFSFYLVGNDDAVDFVELIVENGSDDVDHEGDFARGLKLIVIPQVFSVEKISPLTGAGVGQYKGGTVTKSTKFRMEYEWLLAGTIMESQRWILELGWIGLGFSLLFWIVTFWHKGKRNPQLTVLMIVAIILIYFYNNSLLLPPSYMVIIYLVLMSKRLKVRENQPSKILQVA